MSVVCQQAGPAAEFRDVRVHPQTRRNVRQVRGVPVGRASVELFVIAVGVLAALGVDRWVARIDEREIERAYLEALRVDFEANRTVAVQRESAERQLRDLGTSLIRFLSGERPEMSPEEVVIATELSGYTVYRTYSRGAWDDLSATGSTVIIRDPELRIALSEFYHRLSWVGRLEAEFFDYTLSYRYPARETIDPELRLAMNTAFGGWSEGFVDRTREALVALDLGPIAAGIAQVPELAVPLGDVVMVRGVAVAITEDDMQLIDAILKMIDRAVGAL
jgi:hypothetical protein